MLTSKKDHGGLTALFTARRWGRSGRMGHPAVTKRYTHCERRYGQYDWDVSSSASQVVSRSVSGVQTAVSARHQRRTRGPLGKIRPDQRGW